VVEASVRVLSSVAVVLLATGRSPAVVAEEGEAESVPVTLRVLARDGTPVRNARVVLWEDRKPKPVGHTREDGSLVIPQVWPSRAPKVVVHDTELDGSCWGQVELVAPETTLRSTLGSTVELASVDGQTGAAIGEASRVLVVPLDPARTLSSREVKPRAPPRGYVWWPEESEPTYPVPGARVRIICPLRPEVRLVVRGDADPDAPPPPRVERVFVAGRWMEASVSSGPTPGEQIVAGVPFLRGEPIALVGSDGTSECSWIGRIPASSGETVVARLSTAGPHPRTPAAEGPPFGEPELGEGGRDPALPSGVLGVIFERRDGRPYDGMSAWLLHEDSARLLGSLGAEGARFRGIPAGTWSVFVTGPEVLSAAKSVRVDADEVVDVTLHEPPSAAVRIRVIDFERRPAPFASVRIVGTLGVGWWDVRDRVQRVDSFTNAQGNRELPRIAAGTCEVEARLGSRVGRASVTVPAASTRSLTVVLPRADEIPLR
jgi:hypothetical protein